MCPNKVGNSLSTTVYVIFVGLLLFPELLALTVKTCLGTDFVLASPFLDHPDHFLDDLRTRYRNCTHVVGNLQLTRLSNQSMEEVLIILEQIKDVSGHVVIYDTHLERLALPNLRVIRGKSLFRINPWDAEYALLVANSTFGQLEFPKLKEISNGSVGIYANQRMCQLEGIKWEEIMTGKRTQFDYYFSFNPTTKTYNNDTKGESKEKCEVQSPKEQKCSSQCYSGLCFGPGLGECCHPSCVGGCSGPGSGACDTCKHVYSDGECKDKCPSGMYSFGVTCLASCPLDTVIDEDDKSCLPHCPYHKYEKDRHCVKLHHSAHKCRGPSDMWPWVHSENINYFENCTILEWDMLIDTIAFEGGHEIPRNFTYSEILVPIDPVQLEIFMSLQEVTGTISIRNVHHSKFESLKYFQNLEVITANDYLKTKSDDISKMAIRVTNTSIKALELRALRKILGSKANVEISDNKQLCFVNSIDWWEIIKSRQSPSIKGNRDGGECIDNGQVCAKNEKDEAICDLNIGCWGPLPKDCACLNYRLGDECVTRCGEGYFADNRRRCVRPCSEYQYDLDGVCNDCHQNCKGGCTGPGDFVGNSGCKSCYKKIFMGNITKCISSVDKCPANFFLDSEDEGTDALVCKECHPWCKRCIGPGFRDTDCKECADGFYMNMERGTCLRCVDDTESHCAPIFKTAGSDLLLTMSLIGAGALFIVLTAGFCWSQRRHRVNIKGSELVPLSPVQLTGVRPNLRRFRTIPEKDLRRDVMMGRGAFGMVYRGVWIPEEDVKIQVAIKVLHGHIGAKESGDFINEGFIMASLEHPHLLELLALCLSSSDIMLVTQLMPLGCLRDYLRCHKDNIGSQSMLNWSTQIAQGMEYLEIRNFIHRDLAARNVLVNSPSSIKITDFGLTRLLNLNEDEYRAQMELLPIYWMSMESLQRGIFSTKSDVWSFGVVVWEMLSYGETPFANMTFESLIDLLESGQRLEQPPNCTLDLYLALIKTWMPDQESRPSFSMLVEMFSEMCSDPGRYIVIPGDDLMRLPEYTSQDERELLLGLAAQTDVPDQLMGVQEYFRKKESNYPLDGDGYLQTNSQTSALEHAGDTFASNAGPPRPSPRPRYVDLPMNRSSLP